MAQMKLVIEIDDPEELIDIGAALRGVLGEPDEVEEAPPSPAAEPAAPQARRSGRRRGSNTEAAAPATTAADQTAGIGSTPAVTAPVVAPAPVSPPAAAAPVVDPAAAFLGGAPAAPPSFEDLSTLVQQSMQKWGSPVKAIELAKKHGSTGTLNDLPEANRRAFYDELQAAMAA